jgi:hypothetical protein
MSAATADIAEMIKSELSGALSYNLTATITKMHLNFDTENCTFQV